MRQITLYIYNYPSDRIEPWRCNRCGHLLMEVKGQVAYIVTSPGIPVSLVKMPNVGYLRTKCSKCNTIYNALIYTFSHDKVSV